MYCPAGISCHFVRTTYCTAMATRGCRACEVAQSDLPLATSKLPYVHSTIRIEHIQLTSESDQGSQCLMSLAYPAIIGLAIVVGAALRPDNATAAATISRSEIRHRLGRIYRRDAWGQAAICVGGSVGPNQRSSLFSDGKTILFGLVGGYFGVVVAKWSLEIRARTGGQFCRACGGGGWQLAVWVVSSQVAAMAHLRPYPGVWCFRR